jgi:hypothetical protein
VWRSTCQRGADGVFCGAASGAPVGRWKRQQFQAFAEGTEEPKRGIGIARALTMNRILALALAAFVASPLLVACAGSDAPAQNNGVGKYEKQMSQADAQKLMNDMAQAGPVCRRALTDCSYSAPDANGMVVFQADVMCGGDACSLLQMESNCP